MRDISVGGARISLSRKPGWHKTYLLDTGNRVAYFAIVVSSKSNSAGLSFQKSHVIGIDLPPELKFIWRLVLETKLKEVEGVVAIGVPVDQAHSQVFSPLMSAMTARITTGLRGNLRRGLR